MLDEIAARCTRAYMARGRTDLRCGIPSLLTQISELYGADPYEEGVLYLFRGRSRRRVRALARSGGAFVMLTLLYDPGLGPAWDHTGWGLRELGREELLALLSGGREA